MTKKQILIMSLACGTIAANLYYSQPLLPLIAKEFHVNESTAGLFPTLTQFGYAFGLIAILPLADIREKRKLILTFTPFSILFLFLLLIVKNFTLLLLIAFMIGLSSVIPQLLIPLANQLTEKKDRGKITGNLMSGLLAGILLSRVLSGFMGEYFGWKSIYMLSIVLVVLTTFLLKKHLPKAEAISSSSYVDIIKTIPSIIKKYPLLMRTSLFGGLSFFVFSSFWTTISLFLKDYYHTGSAIAGLIGIVGLSGVLFSNFIGKFSDRYGSKKALSLSTCLTILSFVLFFFFSTSYFGLFLGVILLDVGGAGVNVSCQSIVHKLSDQERSRITAIYMTCYFIGGALGSYIGAKTYAQFGWNTVNILCCLVGIAIFVMNNLKQKNENDLSENLSSGDLKK